MEPLFWAREDGDIDPEIQTAQKNSRSQTVLLPTDITP